jgi:acyl carrier protein
MTDLRRNSERIYMTEYADMYAIKTTIRKVLTDRFSIAPSSIEDHTSVADLGINSIAVLELARTISEEFGVEVGISLIYEGPSIQELAATVHRMVIGAGQVGG